MYKPVNEILLNIRTKKPLILNITNLVTMNFIANGLLSLGASPIMSQASEEMNDLMSIANALVINIGTLNPEFMRLCKSACTFANKQDVPIILDPVGVGASRYRTMACLELLELFKVSIIRGNGSEIMALAGANQNTKGVDSSVRSESAIENAKAVAKQYQTLVVVSGQTDVVVDKDRVEWFDFGSDLMPMVTGSGCLLTSVTAAFHAVCPCPFEAASGAVVFYGICGELASQKTKLPGSFAVHFLDALASTPEPKQYKEV